MHGDGMYDVSCMEYVDKFESTNKFRWPSREDVNNYDREDLLLKLTQPTAVGTAKRLLHFALNDGEFKDAGDILSFVLN